MQRHLATLSCVLVAFSAINPSYAQSRKFVIAVIGSSTAQGVGATPIDSSWVDLTKFYFRGLGEIDTVYNIALGGQTTYDGMPSDFTSPAGRPAPDLTTNVTKALSFNPDVVLINFPTNDAAADYTLAETMSNLRTIYHAVTDAGKIAFVTTSQPRSSIATVQQKLLKTMRDSILAEFTTFGLDFYTPIVAADSLDINPIYDFDDTHVNDAGHQRLFQVVKSANILSGIIPLPLTLLNFSAMPSGQTITLHWTIEDPDGPLSFAVQRSNDGKTFTVIGQRDTIIDAASSSSFSWTDDQPLAGVNYYRLKYTDNSNLAYSKIIAANIPNGKFAIGRLSAAAGAVDVRAELLTSSARTATVTVLNLSGETVLRKIVSLSPPFVIVDFPTSGWSAGQYFLHVVTDRGEKATRAFLKF
jgi:acyl-CoA thioesterase-1